MREIADIFRPYLPSDMQQKDSIRLNKSYVFIIGSPLPMGVLNVALISATAPATAPPAAKAKAASKASSRRKAAAPRFKTGVFQVSGRKIASIRREVAFCLV